MKIIPFEKAQWPSGNYLNTAILSVSPAYLENVLGCQLLRGIEDGLGDFLAIGIETSSGVAVELVQYENTPYNAGFTVRIDSGSDYSATLNQLLIDLLLSEKDVSWLSSSIKD